MYIKKEGKPKLAFTSSFLLWAGWESNPHELFVRGILSPLRLPFRHQPKTYNSIIPQYLNQSKLRRQKLTIIMSVV